MIIHDKDVQEFKEVLDRIGNDFEKWKHTSITKDFLKDYGVNYFHAQAILEKDLLDVRAMMGNARQKEYRWKAGEPTLVMSRELLNLTEDIKQGKINKPAEYTYENKVEALKSVIHLADFADYYTDDNLERIIKAVEYIYEHEWDSKLHDLLKIMKD